MIFKSTFVGVEHCSCVKTEWIKDKINHNRPIQTSNGLGAVCLLGEVGRDCTPFTCSCKKSKHTNKLPYSSLSTNLVYFMSSYPTTYL